jgi:hypothetical protein
MPEVNQYLFPHKELLEMLIKRAGVHEGKWGLIANLGFTPGNFGPSPEQMNPGAAVLILQMGIQKAGPEIPDSLSMDAASVNPPQKVGRRK